MTSSISSLSLFILVLISGYLTLPIIDNQFSDVTSSPFDDAFTTESTFNSRAIFVQETATTSSDDMKRSENELEFTGDSTMLTNLKRSSDELTQIEMTTDISRQERMMAEPFMGTTEETRKEKREMENPSMMTSEQVTDIPREERMMEESFMGTTEGSRKEEREMEDSSMMPVEERMMREPFMGATEESHKEEREMTGEQVTDVPREERMMGEPFMGTTEESRQEKREMKDSFMMTGEIFTAPSYTVSEVTMETAEARHGKRALEIESSTGKQTKELKVTGIRSEFTTVSMPLFTTVSSAAAPELYTKESTTFSPIEVTTQKYIGSLVNNEEDDDAKDSRKDSRKPKKVTKVEEEEEHDKLVDSEERKGSKQKHTTEKDSSDSKEDNKYVKGLLFDEDKSKTLPKLPNNFAILDESVQIVTDMSNTTPETIETITEETKLTQGKKSS